MTEQTLRTRTDIGTIDTSHLSLPLVTGLADTPLKHALIEVVDPRRPGPAARGGGFENKISG
jgi:hypothetical protein